MNRRIVPFALIVTAGAWAYACSSSNSDNPSTGNPGDPIEAGNPDSGGINNPPPDSGPPPDGGVVDGGDGGDAGPILDPVQGIAAPRLIGDIAGFADGPQWIPGQNVLYVSAPLTAGGYLLRVDPALAAGNVTEVRQGDGALTGTIGNSLDKGALISAERKKVTRTVIDGGVVTDIATQFAADGGPRDFDTPNDLVAHSNGTIYVTDPGFFVGAVTNHLVRIAPGDAGAFAADEFANLPRPNGIALTKDEKTLYISFTFPAAGAPAPILRKYTVNPDGTLKDPAKFIDLPAESEPDGLAVDDNGNVYVALKSAAGKGAPAAPGINVYKADGTRYGADATKPSIATPGNTPTGMTFGGADRKSLFVTTATGKIFEVKVNVPGLLQ